MNLGSAPGAYWQGLSFGTKHLLIGITAGKPPGDATRFLSRQQSHPSLHLRHNAGSLQIFDVDLRLRGAGGLLRRGFLDDDETVALQNSGTSVGMCGYAVLQRRAWVHAGAAAKKSLARLRNCPPALAVS